MTAFDSHAHLDLVSAGDPQRLRAWLRSAVQADIRGILVPAVHPERWSTLIHLVLGAHKQSRSPRLFVAFGLHPWALQEMTEQEARAALFELHRRCHTRPRTPSWVMIGEAGLDFALAKSAQQKARQVQVLREQMLLARRMQMPMTLHCVRAYGPLIELLREEAPPSSVIHGFRGKAELARQLCAMGHFIGVGPAILDPRSTHLRAALPAIPIEQLVLESDADDPSAPIQDPHILLNIATQAAKYVGQTPKTLLHQCYHNVYRLLGLALPARVDASTKFPEQAT